jgi:hypothetical protein
MRDDAAAEPLTRSSVVREIATLVMKAARGRLTLEEAIKTVDAGMPTFEAISEAVELSRQDHASRARKTELALRNCLAMALRMQRSIASAVCIPANPWANIVRFCAEAGVVPNILRGDQSKGQT